MTSIERSHSEDGPFSFVPGRVWLCVYSLLPRRLRRESVVSVLKKQCYRTQSENTKQTLNFKCEQNKAQRLLCFDCKIPETEICAVRELGQWELRPVQEVPAYSSSQRERCLKN